MSRLVAFFFLGKVFFADYLGIPPLNELSPSDKNAKWLRKEKKFMKIK